MNHIVTFLFSLLICAAGICQPNMNIIKDVVVPPPTAGSLGKFTEVGVSHHTGTPDVSIPIYTLQEVILPSL